MGGKLAVAAVVLAALVTASAASARGPGAFCPEHWVAAWGASPSDAAGPLGAQTARMVVAPHLAGTLVRVRLSNRFGDAPATLGPVTVALRGEGATVVPGTVEPVLFDGRPSVTIPAGAEVASDPVAMQVEPFVDLSVSVAIPDSVDAATEHVTTRQTNYLSPRGSGDHSADAGDASYDADVAGRGWYFLDGVDVLAPAGVGAVATFGDSLTDGFEGHGTPIFEDLADVDENARYPDYLARRLLAAGEPLSVVNAGIGGNRLLTDGVIPAFGPSGMARVASDVLAQPGVTDVVVLEGINDIDGPAGVAPSELIGGLEQLVQILHGAGLRVLLGTLTPTGGMHVARYGDGAADARRQQVNAWIRAQRASDGVVDFDAAVREPEDPSRLDPAYDSGDHLHLSGAGYERMADALDLTQLREPACQAPTRSPVVHVTPRAIAAGRRATLRFRVSDGRPVAGASVTFAGLRALTDPRGVVTFVVRVRRAGSYVAVARADGAPALTTVRVRRPAQP